MQAAPGMFHDLYLPVERFFDPLAEAFLLVSALGPDQLETRKDSFQRCKQELATASNLNIGLMHQHLQDQPIRIDQQVASAFFDFFAAIVAAKPPISLVFPD